MTARFDSPRTAARHETSLPGRAPFRAFGLAIALLLTVLTGSPPAVAQDASPRFHGAPEGGPRLKEVCRVQGLVQGGVINVVNPVAEANRRREKVRGVATTLLTLVPERTDLTFLIEAEGETVEAAAARLEGKRAAVEGALVTGGIVIIDRQADESFATIPLRDQHPARILARLELVLGLEGEVDPLAVVAAVPHDTVAALVRVEHHLPTLAEAIHPLRVDLEREADKDAAARASARGDGLAAGQRVDLEFLPGERRFMLETAARRTLQVSAVATYVLSRPPGSTAVEE